MNISHQKQMLSALLLLLTVSCISSDDSSEKIVEVESTSQTQKTLSGESSVVLEGSEKNAEVFQINGETLLAANCGINVDIQSKDAEGKIINPCLNKGISANVEITNLSNKLVSRFKSDSSGKFSVKLKAGEYIFVAKGSRLLGSTRQTIRISGSQNITLIIQPKFQVR